MKNYKDPSPLFFHLQQRKNIFFQLSTLLAAALFYSCASGVSCWWLLAPNTPRQDRRPCTRRKNSIFAPESVSTPVDQGANQRFSPWTPSSFSPDPRCRNRIFFYPCRRNMVASGKKEQGVQRANHSVCPLPGKCRKKRKAEISNFGDGCRAHGPAEGCWGREATN